MDHGVPSCRFAGDGGEVFVEADSAVDPAGVPVASADQFNGAVDDVYVHRVRTPRLRTG